jgi:hypothetical protein
VHAQLPDETAALYKKIRKLLRMAATPGPEGENAQVRADELMKKHKLDVKLEEESFRLIVENVAGVFWREQLLYATTATRKCKLMLGTEKQANLASILGEKQHAEDSLASYHVLASELETECKLDWNDFVRVNTDPYRGDYDHVFRLPEVVGVWSRMYLINAAQTLRNRMTGSHATPVPEEVDPDELPRNGPIQRVAESKKVDEEARTERELNALEQILGVQGAEALQVTAWSRGMDLGNAISVEDGSNAKGAKRLAGER